MSENISSEERERPTVFSHVRSQRMWSDPVIALQRIELSQTRQTPTHSPLLRPLRPTTGVGAVEPSSALSTLGSLITSPVTAAICHDADTPLLTHPTTVATSVAQYRAGLLAPCNNINHTMSSTNNNTHNNVNGTLSGQYMDLTTISPAHLSAFARIQHDLDLYEEEDDDRQNQYSHLQGYTCSFSPRAMKQAPKLMTLDDYNLVSLGYKPIMSRRLHRLTLAGITVTSSNAVCGVMALYGIAITNGGPAWATWGFLGIGLMSIVVSLCLAELASAYPTTAGVHHWVYQLGSSRRRAYMSWMVGWFTIVNAVTVTASVAFYFAAIISQLLETTHKLSQTTATLVMFHLSAMFAWQILNLFSIRGIGYISTFSSLLIVAIAVALISAMLSLTGVAASTSHLPFTVFFDYSGSGSAVYAILSSTLMASFVFCPQDSVIRMAEETHRPERPMPWMVIGSTILSLCIGLPLVIVLDYGMTKPIKGLLDDTIPSVRVLLEIMGHMTGTVFTSLILVCVFFAGFNRLAIASRVAYSFARDGGIPHSIYWNHLHPSRKTPQRVSWLVTAACMCCVFPFFWGNSIAFQWISSLACISTNICFVIPLWMRLTHEGSLHFIEGTFTLGRWSKFLHVVSIIWLLSLSVVLMLPSTLPVNKNTFNYAPVVLLILAFMFAISWRKARTDFTGGAKDASRASHRYPSGGCGSSIGSQPLHEICPRKTSGGNSYSFPVSGAITMAPFHPQHSVTAFQQYRNPAMDTLPRYHQLNRSGLEQSTIPRISLSPPMRRDPLPIGTVPFQSPNLLQKSARVGMNATGSLSASLGRRSEFQAPQQHRAQASNMTSTSIASDVSHPDSVLGLPLTESPEMMARELPTNPSTAAAAATIVTDTTSSKGTGNRRRSKRNNSPKIDPVSPVFLPSPIHPSSAVVRSSNLALTRPFKASSSILPEIFIAPPTIASTSDESAGRHSRKSDYSKTLSPGSIVVNSINNTKEDEKGVTPHDPMARIKGPLPSPIVTSVNPSIPHEGEKSHASASAMQATSSSSGGDTTPRPMNMIDRMFKVGLGLTSSIAAVKQRIGVGASGSSGGSSHSSSPDRHRPLGDRIPTPYPNGAGFSGSDKEASEESSKVNHAGQPTDEIAAALLQQTRSRLLPADSRYSDLATLTPYSERSHPSSQGLCPSSNVSDAAMEGWRSIEDVVSSTGITPPLSSHPSPLLGSISPFPTLDGYPLLRSPSSILLQDSLSVRIGDGSIRNMSSTEANANTGAASDEVSRLSLSMMLPLSRTPTIQQNDHEYDLSIKLERVDTEDDINDAGNENKLDSRRPDGKAIKRIEVLQDVDELRLPQQQCNRHGQTFNHDTTRSNLEQVTERDSSYEEEYHHYHPVISKSRIRSASSSHGLFQLQNRDISSSLPFITFSTSQGQQNQQQQQQQQQASTLVQGKSRPLPPTPQSQSQQHHQQDRRRLEPEKENERYDPIERLFQARQQEIQDIEQQRQQRSSRVIAWANEQAHISARRIAKRQARKRMREESQGGLKEYQRGSGSTSLSKMIRRPLERSSSFSYSSSTGTWTLSTLSETEKQDHEEDYDYDEEEYDESEEKNHARSHPWGVSPESSSLARSSSKSQDDKGRDRSRARERNLIGSRSSLSTGLPPKQRNGRGHGHGHGLLPRSRSNSKQSPSPSRWYEIPLHHRHESSERALSYRVAERGLVPGETGAIMKKQSKGGRSGGALKRMEGPQGLGVETLDEMMMSPSIEIESLGAGVGRS